MKLAIDALEKERRARYATGHAAYMQGIRKSVMEGEFTGDLFGWVEDDHKRYLEYSDAIQQLEDMIEVIEEL